MGSAFKQIQQPREDNDLASRRSMRFFAHRVTISEEFDACCERL
jgi:hypothetical protein